MKYLVLLSGGQDSTTALFWALKLASGNRSQVVALTINYGQRHVSEVDAARAVACDAGVEHHVVQIPVGALCSTSPLIDHARKVDGYASAADLPGGIEATFVPMRNLLFLAIAANWAIHLSADTIIAGVSAVDFGGYPDCRPEFIDAAQRAIGLAVGDDGRAGPSLSTPLIGLSKAETVELATRCPGAMSAMALTHTCYRGERPPCGECHACILRAQGFEEAGFEDPLLLACAAEAGPKERA